MGFKAKLIEFATETSIHGLKFLLHSSNIKKIAWTFFIITSFYYGALELKKTIECKLILFNNQIYLVHINYVSTIQNHIWVYDLCFPYVICFGNTYVHINVISVVGPKKPKTNAKNFWKVLHTQRQFVKKCQNMTFTIKKSISRVIWIWFFFS